MSKFFPYQRLRIDYHVDGNDQHSYQGPGEYLRPVIPEDEDQALPESSEPMHYVRIVLGNDTSEHIFPESALSPAPQRDLGGLMDRVHDMLDQIGPIMTYLDQQLDEKELTRVPFSTQPENSAQFRENYDALKARLRDIAAGTVVA